MLAHRHQGLRQGDGLGAHADRERGLVKAMRPVQQALPARVGKDRVEPMRQEAAGLPAQRAGGRSQAGLRKSLSIHAAALAAFKR